MGLDELLRDVEGARPAWRWRLRGDVRFGRVSNFFDDVFILDEIWPAAQPRDGGSREDEPADHTRVVSIDWGAANRRGIRPRRVCIRDT